MALFGGCRRVSDMVSISGSTSGLLVGVRRNICGLLLGLCGEDVRSSAMSGRCSGLSVGFVIARK